MSRNIDTAKSLVTPNIERLFHAEIANECDGGVSPSTLFSAVDSMVQAPDIMCEGWTSDDFIKFIHILEWVGDKTELREILP
jgi:hypothetical protein